MEAAEVGPLVGVEREDGEQRGHGLPVIPRERRTVKARNTPILGLFLGRLLGTVLAAGQAALAASAGGGNITFHV